MEQPFCQISSVLLVPAVSTTCIKEKDGYSVMVDNSTPFLTEIPRLISAYCSEQTAVLQHQFPREKERMFHTHAIDLPLTISR